MAARLLTTGPLVSLVPSTTETLFALGLGERVVGVTDFCTRPSPMPPHVRRIGGTKTPDVAAIRALAPALVLANREENREADVAALAAITAVDVAYPRSVPEAVADIRRLGALLGAAPAADVLADRISAAADDVRAAAAPFTYAYLVWRRPWMAAGGDTFIDAFLGLGGGGNVFGGGADRYPKVTLADLAAADPDVVLLSDEPYPFEARHAAEIGAAPGTTPGTGPSLAARCLVVRGDNVCWHGARLAEGLPAFAGWLAGGRMGESEGWTVEVGGIRVRSGADPS